ncbi:MAG TPA: ABC transporter ATP-binding protein [Amaricoccus sp.]|nr:ABC transporter ATP-binding protein [Amaricoccus sp.]
MTTTPGAAPRAAPEIAAAAVRPAAPLLELTGVTKSFGAMTANDDVALSIMPGEIHAILGENGAGKSTLMKMIYGVLAPDAGRIRWNGEDVVIRDPAHARRLGIGMVFQHFSLFETLTVAENISLSTNEKAARLGPRIAEIGARFGLPLDPAALVHSLSVGQRQRAEIIRCLLQEPRLIIMDEPTSVLPPSGVAPLFETIRGLAAGGCSVLFISHKLEEIRSLCHRATIMRAGKVVGCVDPAAETKESLARLMIGRAIPHPTRRPAHPGREAALELCGLDHEPEDPFGTRLEGIELAVRPGEILGIAGVSGNGQKEIAALLSGETLLPRAERERIRLGGTGCGDADPGRRRRMGLAFVPEERNGRGAVPEMSLTENALLTAHGLGMVRRGFVAHRRARDFAESCIAAMDVRCAGARSEARSLSGGNLQKFIIGREIRLAPKVLIASQPTWGVDVGAAAAIRQELIGLRDRGVAILIISDELDELFEVADRLQVLFRGRLSPVLDRAEADTARIGDYMTGGFLGAPVIATAA